MTKPFQANWYLLSWADGLADPDLVERGVSLLSDDGNDVFPPYFTRHGLTDRQEDGVDDPLRHLVNALKPLFKLVDAIGDASSLKHAILSKTIDDDADNRIFC